MTNYEKYKDELIKITFCGGGFGIDTKTHEPTLCASIKTCQSCLFGDSKHSCEYSRLDWLNDDFCEKPIIPDLGAYIRIIDAGDGAKGCNHQEGFVVNLLNTQGLLKDSPGYNVLIKTDNVPEVWRISNAAKIELIRENSDILKFLPLNTKMLVSNDDSHWRKGYFAGISNSGKVCTYAYGATSWSNSVSTIGWEFAKLAGDND